MSSAPSDKGHSSGGLMDRILEQMRAGERVNIEALAREFGEPAEQVHRLITVAYMLDGAGVTRGAPWTSDRARRDGGTAGPSSDACASPPSGDRLAESDTRPAASSNAVGATVRRVSATAAAGQELGDFRLVAEIGRGGMGVVYDAQQRSLNRRVALKLLAPGARIDGHAIERFKREALAAGRLQHRHIVPVYAVGEHDGVPYYAMQFIEGRPLSAVIRALRREHRPRDAAHFHCVAAWGRDVATALAHAHERGVIHRDIKPSNILVDRQQHVWVADFGLARFEADCSLTTSGDLLGTVRYMSPEQARGGGQVDERTDVYSLGVTLYELALLRPPFGGRDRASTLKRVLLDPPPRMRHVDRAVPLGLQTIIEKAIAKDPADRYPSSALLAEDLQRFLDGRKLIAEPPSVPRQLARLVARHRLLCALVGVIIALTSGFGVWMTVLYARAEHLREQTEAGRQAALRAQAGEAQARAQAEDQAARAALVQRFLERMLASIDPEVARSRDVTLVRDVLDEAAARVDSELADQPAAQAALHLTIGTAYQSIWELAAAERHLRRALETRRALSAADADAARHAAELADALAALSGLEAAKGDYVSAERLLDEALALRGDDPQQPALRARDLRALGVVRFQAGRYQDAAAAARQAVELLRGLDGGDTRELAVALGDLGMILTQRNELAEAIAALNESHALLLRRGGPNDPRLAAVLHHLGEALFRTREYDEAGQRLAEALALRREVYGERDPRLASTLSSLAITRHIEGRNDEALRHAREALELVEASLGADHPDVVARLTRLAGLELAVGNHDEAERLLRDAIDRATRSLGERHDGTMRARILLATALSRTGRPGEALELNRQVVAARRATYGDSHPLVAGALGGLSANLRDLGRLEEARDAAAEALAVYERAQPPGDPVLADGRTRLALIELLRDDLPAAEALLREALDIVHNHYGDEHWRVAEVQSPLGECLARQGRLDQAEPLLRSGYEGLHAALGPADPRTHRALQRLVEMLRATGRDAEADAAERPAGAAE